MDPVDENTLFTLREPEAFLKEARHAKYHVREGQISGSSLADIAPTENDYMIMIAWHLNHGFISATGLTPKLVMEYLSMPNLEQAQAVLDYNNDKL